MGAENKRGRETSRNWELWEQTPGPFTTQGYQAEAKFKTSNQRKANIKTRSSLNSSGTCPNCTLESRGTLQKH